jgi:hypothetical protein
MLAWLLAREILKNKVKSIPKPLEQQFGVTWVREWMITDK